MGRILAILVAACPILFAIGQSTDEHAHDTIHVKTPEVADEGPRPDLKQVAISIIDKTNAFRKEQDRKPVKVNDKLTQAAQYFANYMAKTDDYGHQADGKQPAERAKKYGYEYCIVLENIAYAYDSTGFNNEKLADLFQKGWEKSPGHRKNMLDPDVSETAVAIARSETTGHYYAVQMFGRPQSQAIEFSIANRTDASIDYTLGGKKFTLQAKYTQTHTICRPADLIFNRPGDNLELPTIKPNANDKFIATKQGMEFKVTKDQ